MRKLSLAILLPALILAAIGLATIYSAAGTKYFTRQLLFLPVAAGVLVGSYFIPRRVIYGLTELGYLFTLILLVLVRIIGSGPGSHRWFMLGPVSIQPSELAKVTVVLMLAKYLSLKRNLTLSFRDLTLPVLITLIPALLVAVEPDLSTATIFPAALATMLYWQGLRPFHLLILFVPLISFAAGFSLYTWVPFFVILAVIAFWRTTLLRGLVCLAISSIFGLLSPVVLSMMKEYQRARIRSFFAPWFDPHGMGWNAIQSQIAIGSGRFIGKGYLHGTQTRLGFLPNRHTDFIFSVFGEEFGLLGCLILLCLLGVLVHRFLTVARATRDQTGALICAGFAAIVGFQTFMNIGMLLGLLPITGITLPFMSYGGSSLVANFLMVGLVLNIAARPE
ncbi:MAG: rod shape-determining protein RodA [candidate division WOR-3 bacterium]